MPCALRKLHVSPENAAPGPRPPPNVAVPVGPPASLRSVMQALKILNKISHAVIYVLSYSYKVSQLSRTDRWCMPPDPIPDRGPDEEPASSPLPGGDWDGSEQGLFVCLPAEQVTLAGFAQGGEADTMAPGPLLAAIVDTVTGQDGTGLGGCSDDQLMGIISAARRMESRAAWTQMAAVKEFAARHAGSRPADEFAPEELAFELHLTPQSAAGQMDYASTVAARLPATFAALAAGRIHPVHVRIIEDETRFLNDEDAARADAVLSGLAPGMTFGELRHAAHKLILKLDPEAARKRKDAAKQDAHVRRFREDSGNAGMVARELPSDEVLASWQHVEQRALDLRAAGMPGTLQELRVRAYLDLLQERDSRDQPAPLPAGEPRPAARTGPRRTATHPAMPTQTTPAPAAPTAPDPAPLPAPDRPRPRPRFPSRRRSRAEPGRAGHPHHPLGHPAGPVRDARRSRRVRPAGRRRRPRPGRRRGPPPGHPVVRHRAEPRRHRRRPRLPPRPAPAPRPRTPRQRPRLPEPHHGSGHPRPLRPHPRRDRLPPQPQAGPPDPRPQRHVHRSGLPPPRRPLRPGPHPPLGPGRADLRV